MNHVDTGKEAATELVGAENLLREIFPDEQDRPSLRTLREWTKLRLIPFKRLPGGRLVRFDVKEVRDALDRNFTVRSH